MSEPTRAEPNKAKKSKMPRGLVVFLSLVMTNLLIYVTWVVGVWIADNIGAWLCVILGIAFVFVVPMLSALFGYWLVGMSEDSVVLPATIVSVLFMLSTPSIAPRLIAPNPVCQSSFERAPVDAKRCEFLCFKELEVFPTITASYSTSSKKSSTLHELIAVGAPGDKGPYNVFVEDNEDREVGGLCVWQDRDSRAISSVQGSESGTPSAIPAMQVKDPAGSLWDYRRWLFIIMGSINGLALLLGLFMIEQEERKQKQAERMERKKAKQADT